ncbi:MAG: hypothetical protein EXS06_06790 [Planctomycetaceae bacterium]|nr:hypothetical protein [Planctomycetaceae bacterium]
MHKVLWLAALSLGLSFLSSLVAADEPFRPETGKFPPLEMAHTYRGVLAFADHANRRGSLRVETPGEFFRNAPHPFAMLPYGIVRYHGAPSDLRYVPLSTVMHVRAFLPPDPKTSSVPVLPRGNPERPAENHVLLLEDEPSVCLREGMLWKLKEVDVQANQAVILATREPRAVGDGNAKVESLTSNAATRFWRGRECLNLEDLIAEGIMPASGKKTLGDQAVLLGLTWEPTPNGVFLRYHISDIWLDEAAMQRATRIQTETYKALIRSRWMPAWVDEVEYGKFGRAKVTATLFGGMDAALYADFKAGSSAQMNSVENTLKHTHGDYSPAHMASGGAILEVSRLPGDAPLGSSGIQIRFETDQIIEGIRPGRVVRVRPTSWPLVNLSREEYLRDSIEERFPSPDIFPKY